MEQYAVASSLPIYHQSKPMKARVLLRFIAGLIEQALKAGPSDRKPAPGTSRNKKSASLLAGGLFLSRGAIVREAAVRQTGRRRSRTYRTFTAF
jgi:hypothetical protein